MKQLISCLLVLFITACGTDQVLIKTEVKYVIIKPADALLVKQSITLPPEASVYNAMSCTDRELILAENILSLHKDIVAGNDRLDAIKSNIGLQEQIILKAQEKTNE